MPCKYTINIGDQSFTFNSKEDAVNYIRKNELYKNFTTRVGDEKMNTPTLALALRQAAFNEVHFTPEDFRKYQTDLLDKFVNIEDQSQYFYKVNSAIVLTKGLGKNYEQIDTVKRNLADLGIYSEFGEDIPFDVRYLLTGDSQYAPSDNSNKYYHKLTANNIRILRELDSLSKLVFMERTPPFIDVSNKVIANLKSTIVTDSDKVREIKDELLAFSQIAAYKEWIKVNNKRTSTLRNSLIYDGSDLDNIVDIAKDAIDRAPGNTFLQFILPVSTTVKISKKKQKNIINRDLINSIEGKTRGRLEPDLISTLMDSFSELYQNPTTHYHAKALFDYLLVKDGLMFKNKSFIKMVPTFMFSDMSAATDISTKLMSATTEQEFKNVLRTLNELYVFDKDYTQVDYFTSAERQQFNELFKSKDIKAVKDKLYQKVFNMTYEELYNQFEKIYATDIRFQFNLELIKPVVFLKGGKKKTAEGIRVVKADNGEVYLHVELFSDAYRKLEKGSPERNEFLRDAIFELGEAGFFISENSITDSDESEDNRLYLEFKKYIRIIGAKKGDYRTYELVQVTRDKKNYDKDFTPEGELVPRGTKGIYREITAVGTANSTGVANLGERPTKEELTKLVTDKLKDSKPEEVNKGTNHSMNYKMPASENLTGEDTTTLELVEKGLRIATTRSYALGKVGDSITFEGRPQKYTITQIEQLTKEKVKNTTWLQKWSQKEQWTVEHFKTILGGKTVHVGSWQTSFIKEDTNTVTPTTSEPIAPQPDDIPNAGTTLIQGGIFNGLEQMNFSLGDVGDLPLDFFNDDQVNEEPC